MLYTPVRVQHKHTIIDTNVVLNCKKKKHDNNNF